MRIGIDFGTSYSAAAAVIGGKIEIVKFKDQNQFRTAVFFPAAIPTIESFSISQEDERRVSSIISSFRKEEADNIKRAENARQEALKRPKDKQAAALAMVQNVKRRSDEEHRQTAISIIRREWLEKEQRHAREIIRDQGNALYGEDAIEAYIASPNGHLISSPKSMLGYRLHGNARRILLGVATDILSHIRDAAQRQFNTEVTSAVLGRPVKFRSSMAEAGTDQAISLLTEAAIAAGFLDIEFLEEPSAAAWDHHTQIQEKATVLIVDIGGGTTDIAFSELGQSVGSPIIYQTWGLPKGGNDIDVQLNMRSFMPLFGKGVQGVPVHHFHSAALVHDLPRQAEFHAASFDKLASPYNSRLKRLQDGGNTVRLNRAAERSKIFLSEKENCSIGLSFIEKGLFAKMRREHLADAADATLFRLQETLSNVRSGINKPIDLIYVTGGMSNAPYVRDSIQEVFPSIPLVRGNASTAVVSGLAEFANTINKSDSSMNPYLTRR